MRPGKKTRPRGGDNSYWTSYSDMMAGMLFVFALILLAAVPRRRSPCSSSRRSWIKTERR